MRVAIIGAGLAGLTCAYTLEKSGISPVIYEDDSSIGDAYNHVSCFLKIVSRPVKDPIVYIKSQYDISIRPINTINTLIYHAPNKTAILRGNFGYFIKRGVDADSIHGQIFSLLRNSTVLYNQKCSYNMLAKENDYVILANGDGTLTNELGCWQENINAYAKSAVILGDFDPNTLIMWIDRDYCKAGYAYLTPYDNNKASLTLIVTNTTEKEMESYWDLFLSTEKLEYTIIEDFKIYKSIGSVSHQKIDNILLAGDAGGAIDPFLGFGQLHSITMGALAANAILEGKNYESLITNIIKDYENKYQFRRALNAANNSNYDLLVAMMKIPGVKQLMYDTDINVTKYGANLLKLLRP